MENEREVYGDQERERKPKQEEIKENEKDNNAYMLERSRYVLQKMKRHIYTSRCMYKEKKKRKDANARSGERRGTAEIAK